MDTNKLRKRLAEDKDVALATERLQRARDEHAKAQRLVEALATEAAKATARTSNDRILGMLNGVDADNVPDVYEARYAKAVAAADDWHKAVKLGMRALEEAKAHAAGVLAQELQPEIQKWQQEAIAAFITYAEIVDKHATACAVLHSLEVPCTYRLFRGNALHALRYNSGFYAWLEGLREQKIFRDIPTPKWRNEP